MNAIKLEGLLDELQEKSKKDEIEINKLKGDISQIKSKIENIDKP